MRKLLEALGAVILLAVTEVVIEKVKEKIKASSQTKKSECPKCKAEKEAA